MAPRSPIRLSRRRLLAASGATLAAGAPAALAACGTATDDEDLSPEREAELLNEVLAQQLAVRDAAEQALQSAPGSVKESIFTLRENSAASITELETLITDLGGTPTDEPAPSASQAESEVEGLGGQLESSIAATLEAIRELSPEPREPVYTAITEDAAALAAIRDTLGEEIAPDAFVMGPPAAAEEAG